jgi:hypothetical protein
MNIMKLFFGERSLSKVAAAYDSAADAMQAAQQVERLPHMHRRQVQVIHPHDKDWGRKVEPEGVGIWRTAIRAHVTCGALGLTAALLLFAGLYFSNVEAVVFTPGMSLVAMLLFGLLFGLMAGGLLTMRPDRDAVVRPVAEAADQGRWTVVVHPSSRQQFKAAVKALRFTGVPVASTL